MKRRDFLFRVVGTALALPFALGTMSACGDDGGGDGGDPPDAAGGGGTPDAAAGGTPDARRADAMPAALDCESDGTNVVIGTNHNHAMVVSAADVTAGVDKQYNLQGTSPHPHTVTITAADFATLKQGTMISRTSSNDNGHTHSVSVSCL